jgi:outer membrane protein
MKKTLISLAAMAAVALCGSAWAQKAGSFTASVGVTQIAPVVDSDNLTAPSLPNTKVDVSSSTRFTGAVNYMLTDHIAVHIPLGFGFKHDVTGAGAIAGVGKLAETKALPITIIGQYRFMDANASFRPYIGAGFTYVKFYKEKGTSVLTAITAPGSSVPTTVSFESKQTPTIQLGGTINLNEKWYLDLSYTQTFLNTRGTLSTGQTINVSLNPNGYTAQVGYKF